MRIASRQPERAQRVGIGGVFRLLEGYRDVALGGEIVELIGPDLLDDVGQAGRIRHVAVMQHEPPGFARLAVEQMIDPRRVEQRGPPLDAVDDIALFEQKLRQVAAVLAGDACQKGDFAVGFGKRHLHGVLCWFIRLRQR